MPDIVIAGFVISQSAYSRVRSFFRYEHFRTGKLHTPPCWLGLDEAQLAQSWCASWLFGCRCPVYAARSLKVLSGRLAV